MSLQKINTSKSTLFFILFYFAWIFVVVDFWGKMCLEKSVYDKNNKSTLLFPAIIMLFWGDKLFFPHYVHAIVHGVCLPNQATLHVHNSYLFRQSQTGVDQIKDTNFSCPWAQTQSQSHSVNILNESVVICQWWLWPELTAWYVSDCQSHKVVKFSPSSVC